MAFDAVAVPSELKHWLATPKSLDLSLMTRFGISGFKDCAEPDKVQVLLVRR